MLPGLLLTLACVPPKTGGGGELADAGTDVGPADVRPDAADPRSGRDAGPWTEETCPPRRIITRRLCEDSVTGCICHSDPQRCAPGWPCMGGRCFAPGGRLEAACTGSLPAATVTLNLSNYALGATPRHRGRVNLEPVEGGWSLLLPADTLPRPSVTVVGEVDSPFRDGERVDIVVCRTRLGPEGVAETVQLLRDDKVFLFAGKNAARLHVEECRPSDFRTELEDLNCPPVPEGGEGDEACRVCRPLGVRFRAAGGTSVTAGSAVNMRLGGALHRALASSTVSDCVRTCCEVEGAPPPPAVPPLDYLVVRLEE